MIWNGIEIQKKIVKSSNAAMRVLHAASKFTNERKILKEIYYVYVRESIVSPSSLRVQDSPAFRGGGVFKIPIFWLFTYWQRVMNQTRANTTVSHILQLKQDKGRTKGVLYLWCGAVGGDRVFTWQNLPVVL